MCLLFNLALTDGGIAKCFCNYLFVELLQQAAVWDVNYKHSDTVVRGVARDLAGQPSKKMCHFMKIHAF